ncbi:Xaa-Pro peptidase family protein [bacterium]|nr:Xaa-Pro peptidase family protein [bacterium]
MKKRIEQLQQEIKRKQLSGILLFYSRDIFYYTGTAQPAILVVLPIDYVLFIRSGYSFALRDVFINASKVREERRMETIFNELFSGATEKRIGIELDILPATRLFEYQKIFDGFEFTDITPFVLEQRKTKDQDEIERMRKAGKVIDTGHQAVLSTLKENVSELELAAAIENAHRLAGHEGIFFFRLPDFFMSRGPISSGSNLFELSGVVYSITGTGLTPSVPAGPSLRKIKKGDLVMVDIPVSVNGYHIDQTRTYVLGKANNEQKAMYADLKNIADYLIENIKPGLKCSEIYKMAIERSKTLKYADAFLSFGKGKQSMLIGHSIGLEVNEPPTISSYDQSVIRENYVMAIELHMLKEEIGVVKIEDTILIGKEKNEILTISPRELCEVF